MTNRPQPGIGKTQGVPSALERVDVIRKPVRGLHQGQQLDRCIDRPNTWMHLTIRQNVFSPCTGRAVHTWTPLSQTS